MKETLLNELDKYFNLPDDLSEIEYIEMICGDNIEDIFLWYYRRQLEELHWYKYEGEELNKTKPSGAILYELENKVIGWIEAISKAEYYILYSERVTVHYRDNQRDIDIKTIDYKLLVDAIKDCVKVHPTNRSSYRTGDFNTEIQIIGNSILSEFSNCTIGKFNSKQSKVNERFVKSLYPYFLYLKNREENKLVEKQCEIEDEDEELSHIIIEKLKLPEDFDSQSIENKNLIRSLYPSFRHLKEEDEEETIEEGITNRSLYLTIMENLKLPSNYEKQIKNAFSSKTDPPPLKIDIKCIKPYE